MPLLLPIRRSLAATLLLALVAVGCGPPRYSVEGKVAYADGSPYAAEGFVIAEAVVDGKPIMARGMINPDGSFTLTGRNRDEGVLAGSYRLRLVPPPLAGGIDSPQAQLMPFDKKFMKFDTSGLTHEVTGGGGELRIDLGPKP